MRKIINLSKKKFWGEIMANQAAAIIILKKYNIRMNGMINYYHDFFFIGFDFFN
jgi:hypothetical protein